MGFDFIGIMPLLSSRCSFFFVSGCAVTFFGGFQHLPVDGCSTASCNFGAFMGGDGHMSYFAILNRKPLSIIFKHAKDLRLKYLRMLLNEKTEMSEAKN